jgi:hypothetical protein
MKLTNQRRHWSGTCLRLLKGLTGFETLPVKKYKHSIWSQATVKMLSTVKTWAKVEIN